MTYAQITSSRRYFGLWVHAVAYDHFVQAAAVMCASSVPFAVFAAPDLSGVASVILAVTGLVTVVGGILKVRTEQEQRKREWEYDHPPRDTKLNHRPTPDSDLASDEAPIATRQPDPDEEKKQRVRRRRKEKPPDLPGEIPP